MGATIYAFNDGTPSGIRVTSFKLLRVPKGALVRVTCSHHACRVPTHRARRSGSLRLKHLYGKTLRVGTKVVIRVTNHHRFPAYRFTEQWIGRYMEYRVVRGAQPKRTYRRLCPKQRRPRPRCARSAY